MRRRFREYSFGQRGAQASRQRNTHNRSRPVGHPERLESRLVLDASILISEVVSSNDQGLRDEDGDRPDWIELFNAGDESVDLNGWHLTDNIEAGDKWTFPAVTLAPSNFLIVYASGKDRTNPNGPLHANFQLNSDGDYLALSKPDSTTIISAFANGLPKLLPDVSYGVTQSVVDSVLVTSDSEVKAMIPSTGNGGDQLGTTWTQVEFDDSSWKSGVGGVGFEIRSGFEEFIGTDVEAEMFEVSASAYARFPFTISDAQSYFSTTLRMRYDDGYVAYLNGVEVARRNAPASVQWNSNATATHRDSQAKQFEDVDISEHVRLLRNGANVLAIHGLNMNEKSDDFLIALELAGQKAGEIVSHEPRFLETPTPGLANGEVSYNGLVFPIDVSESRGLYDSPVQPVIKTETVGATLSYTTDGSQPSLENGTQVAPADSSTAPIAALNIDRTTTLRVAAFKDGHLPSKVETRSFVFLQDVLTQDVQATLDAGFPETWRRTPADYGMDPDVIGPNDAYKGEFSSQIIDSLKAAPTVSISMDMADLFGDDGIYTNSIRSGFEWERPTSVEFIYPDGSHIQADAGIRIAGDNVRTFGNSKKQSFRLEFRGRYGPTKLRFPLFGAEATDSFDTIILRGGYNDGWVHTPTTTQYIRDHWARTTLLEMEHAHAHGKFMHVYLNGFYWGMYNAVERPNNSFSASYYGGDKDDWDALNTGMIRDGSIAAWNELRSLARDVRDDDQQASNTAFLRLLGRGPDGHDDPNQEVMLDLENYIDYLLVNFYGGNVDWPHRNYYAGRLRGPESTGFKFYAWDTEKILDHGEGSSISTNQVGASAGSAEFYRSLQSNDEFRLIFADHIHRHFFNGGALYVDPNNSQWDPDHPERNVPAARYHRLAAEVELPLIAESARWGDTQSSSVRKDGRTFTLHDWRSMRDQLFDQYFPRRSEIVLQQLIRSDLYPEVAAPVFNQYGGEVAAGFELLIEAPGDVYVTLDGSDPRQSVLDPGVAESGIAPTALRYDGPISLSQGTIVKARTLLDGEWSALNEANFSINASAIRISEIMYHPRDPEPPTGQDDDDFEFIEIVNISDSPFNLNGLAFTQGILFSFSELVLSPGERTVVVQNEAAFRSRYGNEIAIAGEYQTSNTRLSNGGETIRLEDQFGQVVQEFDYDDAWFPTTDGNGRSLTILKASGSLDQWTTKEGWRESRSVDGSPGLDDEADFNGDGLTDLKDVDLFCTRHREKDLRFDMNGDGLIDQNDLAVLIQDVMGTSYGDSNLNGVFDSQDLVTIFRAGKFEDAVAYNSTWSEGDWNCDGDVTTRDFVWAFLAGGYTSANASPHSQTQRLKAVAAAVANAWTIHPSPSSETASRKIHRLDPQIDHQPLQTLANDLGALDQVYADPELHWKKTGQRSPEVEVDEISTLIQHSASNQRGLFPEL